MAGVLQSVCLCGAFALLACWAVAVLWPYVGSQVRASSPRSTAVFLLAALGLSLFAGTKRPVAPDGVWITGENGLQPVDSRGTNDVAYLRWRIDEAFKPLRIPDDAPVRVSFRPVGSASDWTALGTATASDLSFSASVGPGLVATNFEYLVYSGYVKATFDNGVIASGYNVADGDAVTVRWAIDPAHRPFPIDPASAVYVDYRPLGSTNEWGMLGQAVARDLSFTSSVGDGLDAALFEYCVYSDAIPPAPVHTNGEWRVSGMWYEGREGDRIMPLHMKFRGDGETVYPKEIGTRGGH